MTEETKTSEEIEAERLKEMEKRRGEKLALYFGNIKHSGGHVLHGPHGRTSYDPKTDYPGIPWTIGLMDATLLKNGKHEDIEDGRVFWTCGGVPHHWFAFFWWDRSGDKRGNSNSGFYVRGFVFAELHEAFAYACSVYPEIVKRQKHLLKLVLKD